jgi:hypothetical protein
MIKVDQHASYTIQVGKCIAEFDKDYILTVRKIINGKTTYEAEFEEENKPADPTVENLVVASVLRHLNIHGAFSPKNEGK